MTLRHFEIFQAVAETGNFTKAAKKLYITQSAVSHAIRELEERTGTMLFDRLTKRVRLTKCGMLFLKEIVPILASCTALEAHIDHLEKEAPLHLVSSITIASFWLPQMLCGLRKAWPETLVEVEVVSAANAMEILHMGKADLAFVEGVLPQGTFEHIVFSRDELKAVCAPDYLPGIQKLSVEELCTHKLLFREKGSAIRDTVDSAFFLKGCVPRPVWTSVNSLALIQAAKAGLGVTVLPEVLLREAVEKGELVELEIEEVTLKNEQMALWHREQYVTKPMETLLSMIRNK